MPKEKNVGEPDGGTSTEQPMGLAVRVYTRKPAVDGHEDRGVARMRLAPKAGEHVTIGEQWHRVEQVAHTPFEDGDLAIYTVIIKQPQKKF